MAVTGFILAEDAAMKTYLQGLLVNDRADVNGRSVEVWFRDPEPEERPRTYPYISIDLVDISEANDRMQNGTKKMSDLLYPVSDPVLMNTTGQTNVSLLPMPVNIDYQISVNSRSAMHDRQLMAYMWRKFPGKWGALHVPGDETARTMQMSGSAFTHDVDNEGKRLFRQMYRVRVFSELWPADIRSIVRITSVQLSVQSVLDTFDFGVQVHPEA